MEDDTSHATDALIAVLVIGMVTPAVARANPPSMAARKEVGYGNAARAPTKRAQRLAATVAKT